MEIPYDLIARVPAFSLTSTDVHDGGVLPLAQASGSSGPGAPMSPLS